MPKDYKELTCRDVAAACDFEVRVNTEDEVMEAFTAHIGAAHGMRNIPPAWSSVIRTYIRTVQDENKELFCRDMARVVAADCDFQVRAETVEEVIAACATHAASAHGVGSFPPEWYLRMRAHIRTIQA